MKHAQLPELPVEAAELIRQGSWSLFLIDTDPVRYLVYTGSECSACGTSRTNYVLNETGHVVGTNMLIPNDSILDAVMLL